VDMPDLLHPSSLNHHNNDLWSILHAVFSRLLLLSLFKVQTFSSAPCSQTPLIYVSEERAAKISN
jgi:hypothetical protein